MLNLVTSLNWQLSLQHFLAINYLTVRGSHIFIVVQLKSSKIQIYLIVLLYRTYVRYTRYTA